MFPLNTLARGTVARTALLAFPCWAGTALAQITQWEYAARRDALAARFDNGILIAFGPAEWPPINPPDSWRFSRLLSLSYLTGIRDTGALFVMAKRGGRVTNTVFLPAGDTTRSAAGRRGSGVAPAGTPGMRLRSFDELRPVLDSLIKTMEVTGRDTVFFVNDTASPAQPKTATDTLFRSLRAANPGVAFGDGMRLVASLRGTKSPKELALLRRAITITLAAHRAAYARLAPGRSERDIQQVIEHTFRAGGATGPAFPTIVGSGPNSIRIHSFENRRIIQDGDVVVLDIGASYQGYAADVTRTVPVNGKFTPEQRAIYRAVREAQAAAERAAVLGAPRRALDDSARATLERELAALGLLESPTVVSQVDVGMYFPHGVSHPIGLEVHDIDQSGETIKPGDAFTIEPGVYITTKMLDHIQDVRLREKLRPAVERYNNIGVRIEDNYFATERGVEWVSRSPREIDELEAALRTAHAARRAK